MASSYIYKDGNVTFAGIKQISVVTGQKISSGKYVANDADEILDVNSNTAVVNAIDIDWNSATINGISFQPISTSADLLNLIKQIHDKIPVRVTDLVGGSNMLTKDDIYLIKDEFQGKSAYDIAKEVAQKNGQSFTYTEEEWIRSLKGATGDRGQDGMNGASAFEIARATFASLHKDFPYDNEADWTLAITEGANIDEKLAKKQNVLTPGEGIIIANNLISSPLATWINIS